MTADDLLTTQEAGHALGLSDSHIRRLIGQGRLQAVKRGRDWWIPRQALDTVQRRPVGRPRAQPT